MSVCPTCGELVVSGDEHHWAREEMSRAGRTGDSQPMPTHNDEQDIQSQVIADIEARRGLGIKRYGTALQPGNGRNALLDAYEEGLDLVCYLKQRLVEEAREEVSRILNAVTDKDPAYRAEKALADLRQACSELEIAVPWAPLGKRPTATDNLHHVFELIDHGINQVATYLGRGSQP